MSPENLTKSPKPCNTPLENVLHHALLRTELGMDLKERYASGEKYICYLKTILNGADKAVSGLQLISKSCLEEAKHVVKSLSDTEMTPDMRNEYEKLLGIIENQLSGLEMKTLDIIENLGMAQISEKIKYLESKQRHNNSENNLCPPPTTFSNKNLKADIDEKYPENLSRESLIDLNTIVNLPPVPEDIFHKFLE
ncbi:hypothetical protein NQ317_006526 [Molorchus minor]|uniref:Uncharacterized protein n=1 Tax=Molorchus minor TaxID=1323400 RepID=A0ABQ9IWM5_9CUCU|nr:hypothetical protein NQ317_006526 [Molorchus minor]